jgi:hypothetical protein
MMIPRAIARMSINVTMDATTSRWHDNAHSAYNDFVTVRAYRPPPDVRPYRMSPCMRYMPRTTLRTTRATPQRVATYKENL